MISEETQQQIKDLVKRVKDCGEERQVTEVSTFLMYKALELAYDLGKHKDPKNPEYQRKREEYLEVDLKLGERFYIPYSSSIHSALRGIEELAE